MAQVKTAAICTMGLSPPVVTEFVQYLVEAEKVRLTDLTLLATEEEFVRAGVELVRVALRDRYPRVHLHTRWLRSEDISTKEELHSFIKTAASVFKELEVKHRPQAVYLCVAGGRKEMGIVLTMLSQVFGANLLVHLIVKDIKAFNIELERAKHHITQLASAQDKEGFYREHKELFDPLMYPPLHSYNTVPIPILPYPRRVLREVLRLLGTRGPMSRERVRLDEDTLKRLGLSGLVRVGRERVYVTEEGRALWEALKDYVL